MSNFSDYMGGYTVKTLPIEKLATFLYEHNLYKANIMAMFPLDGLICIVYSK